MSDPTVRKIVNAGPPSDLLKGVDSPASAGPFRALPTWWQALVALGPQSQALPLDVERQTARRILIGLLFLSAVAQFLLFRSGTYAISNDESERALIAQGFSWSTLFAASWW